MSYRVYGSFGALTVDQVTQMQRSYHPTWGDTAIMILVKQYMDQQAAEEAVSAAQATLAAATASLASAKTAAAGNPNAPWLSGAQDNYDRAKDAYLTAVSNQQAVLANKAPLEQAAMQAAAAEASAAAAASMSAAQAAAAAAGQPTGVQSVTVSPGQVTPTALVQGGTVAVTTQPVWAPYPPSTATPEQIRQYQIDQTIALDQEGKRLKALNPGLSDNDALQLAFKELQQWQAVQQAAQPKVVQQAAAPKVVEQVETPRAIVAATKDELPSAEEPTVVTRSVPEESQQAGPNVTTSQLVFVPKGGASPLTQFTDFWNASTANKLIVGGGAAVALLVVASMLGGKKAQSATPNRRRRRTVRGLS